MADFERLVASDVACLDPPYGVEARLYRSVTGRYLPPIDVPLGAEPVNLNHGPSLFKRLERQLSSIGLGPELPPLTAVDFVQTCQSESHQDGAKTPAYSTRLELLGRVVLADEATQLEVAASDLWLPKGRSGEYAAKQLLGDPASGRYIPANALVQRLRRAAAAPEPAQLIVAEAAISRKHFEAFVVVDSMTHFLERPKVAESI